MNEPHCRCPGCGECDSHRKLRKAQADLDAAYSELSKLRPTIKGVFDRNVWHAVSLWNKEPRT
jgi:hypothetical protein